MSEMVYQPEMRHVVLHSAARVPQSIKQDVTPALRAFFAHTNLETGEINAEDVVASASDPQNPLHDLYDWDDVSAAHEHRLDTTMQFARVIVDAPTNERLVTSKYAQTNDLNDRRVLKVNVRLLPSSAPREPVSVRVVTLPPAPRDPIVLERPMPVAPASIVAPLAPPASRPIVAFPAERERAIRTLRTWADAYGDDPYFAGVVAAIRMLG